VDWRWVVGCHLVHIGVGVLRTLVLTKPYFKELPRERKQSHQNDLAPP